jgi:hypothetical protein
MNNKVNIKRFIRTMPARKFDPAPNGRKPMFLFNRSTLAVALALVVAALPLLIQYL